LEELPADARAERVRGDVAEHAGDEAAERQRPDVEHALRGEEPRGEEKAVSGKEESDEEAGLGKDDAEDAEQADRPGELLEIRHETGFPRGWARRWRPHPNTPRRFARSASPGDA